MDRDFAALVELIFGQGDWPLDPAFADCLKILHKYRNDAYHRDHIRAEVLNPAVVIYFYLVAHLLKHRKWIASRIDAPPLGVLEVIEDGNLGDRYLGLPGHHWGNLESAMAERLLRDFAIDHTNVANTLSQHLQGRFDAVDLDLMEIADYYSPPLAPREFAIRVAQCTPDELHSEGPPHDFWVRDFPVDQSVLTSWKADARSLAETTDAFDALRGFAAQEGRMSSFEANVSSLAIELDHAIQHQIDVLRGK